MCFETRRVRTRDFTVLSTCHEFTWTYILLKVFLPEKQLQRTFIELKLTKIQFSPATGKAHIFCKVQTKVARR